MCIDKIGLLKSSKLFSEDDIENFRDLDLEDWNNIEQRDLLSLYAFENYYQLLMTPEH